MLYRMFILALAWGACLSYADERVTADEAAIRALLETYFEGGRTGNADLVKTAFHPQAASYGSKDGELDGGAIEGLFKWISEAGAAPGLQADIQNVHITGTAASARVKVINWQGTDYTDYFTLLKLDHRWLIMNEVFFTHDAQQP